MFDIFSEKLELIDHQDGCHLIFFQTAKILIVSALKQILKWSLTTIGTMEHDFSYLHNNHLRYAIHSSTYSGSWSKCKVDAGFRGGLCQLGAQTHQN